MITPNPAIVAGNVSVRATDIGDANLGEIAGDAKGHLHFKDVSGNIV